MTTMTSVHTHKSHPFTSHLAAESVKETSELQRRILSLFDEHGPMTHEELVELYEKQFGPWWPATESSIRSRTRQLVDMTLIVEKSTKKNKRNREAIVWAINDGRLF